MLVRACNLASFRLETVLYLNRRVRTERLTQAVLLQNLRGSEPDDFDNDNGGLAEPLLLGEATAILVEDADEPSDGAAARGGSGDDKAAIVAQAEQV